MAIEDVIAEGDKVAVRLTSRGTHKGDLMGRVVEHWRDMDMLSLMQQLGAMQMPMRTAS